MDWLREDKMEEEWEEVGRDEEVIEVRRDEGRGLPVDKVLNAVGLAATQAKWKGREAKPNEMGNNSTIAWTAQMLEEVVEELKHEDTDEMKQLKDKSQQQVKDLWKNCVSKWRVACCTNKRWRRSMGPRTKEEAIRRPCTYIPRRRNSSSGRGKHIVGKNLFVAQGI